MSPPLVASEFSAKWASCRPNEIPLSIAEMDFPTDPDIVAVINERLPRPLAYPVPYTTGGLADLLSDFYQLHYGIAVPREGFRLVSGVVPVTYELFATLLEPGDEVVYFSPSYQHIQGSIAAAGGVPVPVRLDMGSHPAFDLAELTARLSPRTKAIHLCNPHNPTGHVFTAEELRLIADVAVARGLLVVANELHSRLVHDGHHIPIAAVDPDIADRTVTLDGPSKSHNLAGLGGAFMWSLNASLVADLARRIGFRLSPARAVQQAAIGQAYSNDSAWLRRVRDVLRTNRDLVANTLRHTMPEINFHIPDATYFFWLDLRNLVGEADGAAILRERAGLVVENGRHFGASSWWVRLTFATEEAIMREVLRRLHEELRAGSRAGGNERHDEGTR